MSDHGFRAMAATLLSNVGEKHPDAIERQLAHVEANQARRAYAAEILGRACEGDAALAR
jgi:integrase